MATQYFVGVTRTCLSIISIIVFSSFLVTNAQAEPSVSFSSLKSKIRVGETISLDIVMSDFPVTEGGGLTLKYKSDVIEVTNVTVNEALWSFASESGVIDNQKGKVKDILFSRFPGASGDGVIATIEFTGIKKGKTRLKLKESKRNPFASGGKPVVVSLGKAVVKIKRNRPKKTVKERH